MISYALLWWRGGARVRVTSCGRVGGGLLPETVGCAMQIGCKWWTAGAPSKTMEVSLAKCPSNLPWTNLYLTEEHELREIQRNRKPAQPASNVTYSGSRALDAAA